MDLQIILTVKSIVVAVTKMSVRLKIRNIGGCRASVPAHFLHDQ
ncbi:hypothetical protein Desti_2007 [Desulfomonile tiedjei DSM 6799]|uniref:Uncharacterized protein n=1 Tax=Desulfomonile tiedjei (strain ATCC 49306 / DSM 6799 / DCB-1) TaxID=706587 RepID=I4C570_DESTA|nr:hypothetical protein Desti_2007 [Desulfomonile tiedjei DSM 6799]